MLKWIVSLVLASSVLLNMVAAPPAAAITTQVLITHVQAGAMDGAANQELVSIYNNTLDEINISNWCIANKNSVSFACFVPALPGQDVILPSFSYAVAVSQQFMSIDQYEPSITYVPNHSSYGSITGGGDTISLYDGDGNLQDAVVWSKSLPGGSMLLRAVDPEDIRTYIDTDEISDFTDTTELIYPPVGAYQTKVVGGDVCNDTEVETCNNEEVDDNDSNTDDIDDETDTDKLDVATILITEILPNAAGSDKGKEFIEIYNPNNFTIYLTDYLLWAGTHSPKSYTFPIDVQIGPGQYQYFSNQQIGYSLLNSTNKVWITDIDGNVINEPNEYLDPKEDTAWALIDETWQYTNQPTPGSKNKLSVVIDKKPTAKVSTLKPCASNQYRNPETNRCRRINAQAPVSTLKPCQSNQERNPDTNRCRNIVIAAETPSCPEGKIRNPETNRCKTEVKMPKADYAVKGDQIEQGGSNWYIWLAIGLAVVSGLCYAAWEWRYEVRAFIHKLPKVLMRKK